MKSRSRRVKTPLTPPAALPAAVDPVDSNGTVVAERTARDIEIINRNAARLNAEARDVLGYQRIP
jgi:hypothetical protein